MTSELDARLDLAHDAADLRRRLGDRVGELADLLGDDGEALARLAGARGLDGGVEREDLRLLGDVVDDDEHAADLLAALAQLRGCGRRRACVLSRISSMPSAVSATACMPSSALASVRSAIAATDCELSAICLEVCASSSTVAEVCVTAAACCGGAGRLLLGRGEHLRRSATRMSLLTARAWREHARDVAEEPQRARRCRSVELALDVDLQAEALAVPA